jgi:hypothetical protein
MFIIYFTNIYLENRVAGDKQDLVLRRRMKRELLYALWKTRSLLRQAAHCGKNFANRAILTTKGLWRPFLQENKYLSFSKL